MRISFSSATQISSLLRKMIFSTKAPPNEKTPPIEKHPQLNRSNEFSSRNSEHCSSKDQLTQENTLRRTLPGTSGEQDQDPSTVNVGTSLDASGFVSNPPSNGTAKITDVNVILEYSVPIRLTAEDCTWDGSWTYKYMKCDVDKEKMELYGRGEFPEGQVQIPYSAPSSSTTLPNVNVGCHLFEVKFGGSAGVLQHLKTEDEEMKASWKLKVYKQRMRDSTSIRRESEVDRLGGRLEGFMEL